MMAIVRQALAEAGHRLVYSSILLAMGDELDLGYIKTWAERLGLINLWREVQDQAQNRT